MAQAAAGRAAILAASLFVLWRILVVNAVLVDERGRNRIPEGGAQEVLRSVVRDNPGESAALLGLAGLDEAAGRARAAADKLAAARGIAPISREALEQSAAFLLRQKRYAEALDLLDRMAEQYHDYEHAFPALGRLLAAREPEWDALARRNPPWLGDFIVAQCAQSAVDPALLAPLLMPRTAAGRTRAQQIDCVTQRLRAAGRWEEAYQVWLNTLPRERLAEVGHVFNGGFEQPPSGVGFDWIATRGTERQTGQVVEFISSRGGSGQRALRVAFNGKRQTGVPIRQYLVVPAGAYRFSGRGPVDSLNSARGVQWTLRCAGGERGPLLGASERFLGSSEWRDFDFEVTIPPGCPGQVLQLEPVGMEQGTTFLAGTVWFDDLALVRRR
jgi:tetratricopeptide (TPR) repeat protein